MTTPCLNKDIRIAAVTGRVTVHFDGYRIASSTRALSRDEPGLPLRIYIPRVDVDAAFLEPSERNSFCPFKGEASYHSLKSGDAHALNAVWYYPDPCPLVEPIRDFLAFWGRQVRYEVTPA